MHNDISGRFLGEVTKQVLLDLEASKYQVWPLYIWFLGSINNYSTLFFIFIRIQVFLFLFRRITYVDLAYHGLSTVTEKLIEANLEF